MAWSEKARAEAAKAVDMLDHRKASSMDELTRMIADAALDAAAAVDGDAGWNAAIEEAAKSCDAQARKWRRERQFAASQYLADGVFQERFEQAERDAAEIRSLKRLK